MIVISGVLAIFSWNAGNRALTPINGILFINLVPVITFVISIRSGYSMSKLEVTGAIITIAALVSNNLYQRKLIRAKSAIPAGVAAAGGAAIRWTVNKTLRRACPRFGANRILCRPSGKPSPIPTFPRHFHIDSQRSPMH